MNKNIIKNFFAILFLISFLPIPAFAQKEANHWYFGENAGIDFSSGKPVFDALGKLNTNEGCATISNKTTGELLFYTDGMKAWDKTHSIMPQGDSLWGHNSSTQSGVIVPKPGSDSLYYVFTVGAQAGKLGGYKGVAYSIVNMSLNGGKGDVTLKNQPLLTPACEKITAAKHCNATDIWVIIHQWNSNAFYAYRVTPSGINTPVISNVGSVIQDVGSGQKNETIGYLKLSPDGKKLASANYQKINTLELFDFDNSTGIISNPLIDSSFPVQGGEYGTYGVSFSPDNTKLYVSHTYTPSNIYQYDLSAGSPAMILASRKVIATAPDLSALQLGPDGKIYIATAWKSTLDVINNPNALGAACNYFPDAITLKNANFTASSIYGLPNFIESFFNYFLEDITTCSSQATLDAKNPGASYLWSTGETTQKINVTANGNYWVRVNNKGCIMSDTIKVTFVSSINVNLGKDTIVCDSTYYINAQNTGSTFLWSTGDTIREITIDSTGTYWVQVKKGQCTASDTIKVTFVSPPVVDLGNDAILCEPITLNAGNSGASYQWSTGDTSKTITANNAGIYWVKVSNGVCTTNDSIKITFNTLFVDLGNDVITCEEKILDAGNTGAEYLWSTGDTTKTITADTTENYWVKVQNGICSNTDTIKVTFVSPPVVDLGNDAILCEPITLNAGNSGASYQWSTGDTSKIITANNAGIYWVKVSNGVCTTNDSIKITFNPLVVDLGNDIIACEEKILDAGNTGTRYVWSTGDTTQTITITQDGNYWVRVATGSCEDTDTITVSFIEEQPFLFTPNVFTPNNDTYNDVLDFSIENIEDYHLKIYNRWGELVFKTSDKSKSWDGTTTSGNEVPAGVYFWVLDYKSICGTGQIQNEKGFVHLIR